MNGRFGIGPMTIDFARALNHPGGRRARWHSRIAVAVGGLLLGLHGGCANRTQPHDARPTGQVAAPGTSGQTPVVGGPAARTGTAVGAALTPGARAKVAPPPISDNAPPRPASNIDPASPADPPYVLCDLHGQLAASPELVLWESRRGGLPAARFGGRPIRVAVRNMPTTAGGRARVRTLEGIVAEGFIDGDKLPLFAARDLSVVPDHVWVPAGHPIRLAPAAPTPSDGSPQQAATAWAPPRDIALQAPLSGPLTGDTVTLSAPCDGLALERPEVAPVLPPAHGRAYVPQRGALPLSAIPGGPPIMTLHPREPERAVLMFGTESSPGFVRVVYRDAIGFDAWVSQTDVMALAQGEIIDVPSSATVAEEIGTPRILSNGKNLVVLRAVQPTPIRLIPKDLAPPFATVEPGTELYVVDTILGWASVVPVSLDLLPSQERSFWIRTSDIGTIPPATTPNSSTTPARP